ncbi:MAG TPA: bifunctional ADP-dependent NAD(P)H-hydrate dehydratase/NAD(P)H-hydrate epimerase [Legionellales bacterium]|nr:bifunctional ADP-dependent NAD(P)H-hydrate dehydratase/NAD(P)H-hydrate epimerase [Legionellales bacterium]
MNPQSLLAAHQLYALKQLALSHYQVSAYHLTQLAGKAALHHLQRHFAAAYKILIYCGGGGNAADGYELAYLAHQAGYQVTINQFKTIDKLPHHAQIAANKALDAGVICYWMEEDAALLEADLIIDALIGTGLKHEVHESILWAINQINESRLPVFALDVPSGLQADTGACLSGCVKATITLTFIAKKMGMFTGAGLDYCGQILWDDLGLVFPLNHVMCPDAQLLSQDNLLPHLLQRHKNVHKGHFGHVLIIGGDEGMAGAPLLAATAALRIGAGKVTVVMNANQSIQRPCPLEIMVYGVSHGADLTAFIKQASVCVLGPGLGMATWGRNLFKQVLASQIPMIVDASALRILADLPQFDDNWILTPHAGEAAALLRCSTDWVNSNRYTAINQLQQKYGGAVVLKGAGSLIKTEHQPIWVCQQGNPGMASAGMGDVLSGVIAGLVAQHLPLAEAAKLGVWLHANAGDLAASDHGQKGLLASDVIQQLNKLLNQL